MMMNRIVSLPPGREPPDRLDRAALSRTRRTRRGGIDMPVRFFCDGRKGPELQCRCRRTSARALRSRCLMEAFGVRFTVNDPQRFETLRALFAEVKRDKDAGQFRDPEEWVRRGWGGGEGGGLSGPAP